MMLAAMMLASSLAWRSSLGFLAHRSDMMAIQQRSCAVILLGLALQASKTHFRFIVVLCCDIQVVSASKRRAQRCCEGLWHRHYT